MKSRDGRVALTSALLAVTLCASAPEAASGPPQDPPIEWGVIPPDDLAMTSFPADTNAPAIVLCDYGETTLSNRLELVFTRHTRIKILAASGFTWANQSFSIYTHGHSESARDIEGATYSRDAGGKVIRTDMEESAVYMEQVNEYRTRYRFTLPALRPGCVVEFRYTIKSKGWNEIRPWVFQGRIPVRWSEYRVLMPRQIAYAAVSNKRFPFTVDETTETSHSYSGDAALYAGGSASCYRYRWVVRDAPALVDEPYVSNLEDYAQKMDLQLVEYAHWRSYGSESIATTWAEATKGLLDDEEFGKRIEVTGSVRRICDQVTAGLGSPVEKMNALYDYVRKNIVWTEWRGLYSLLGPDEVLAARKGSVSQMTFLLLSLLKAAGIEAEPVVLSTRSNGKIQTTYPVLSQFDYVISRAKIGNDFYYMDATDPLRPVDLLPLDGQKVGGLVIKEGPVEWVTLNSGRVYSRRTAAHIRVGEGGEIQGSLESVDEQYSALAKRRSLLDTKPLDLAKQSFDADRSGLVIDSVKIEGEDTLWRPVRIHASVTSGTYAQSSGDLIYINPAIIDRQITNPFTSAVRNYPVNMACGYRSTSVVEITKPAGYEVNEIPKDQNIRLNGSDAVFTRLVGVDGPVVRFVTNVVVNRTDYPPSLYAELRQFYERVTAAQSEQMVFRRTPPAAATGTPAAKPKGGSKSKH